MEGEISGVIREAVDTENNLFVLLGEKIEDISLLRQKPVEKSFLIQERTHS